MNKNYSEAAFESVAEIYLLENGFKKIPDSCFDKKLAIFPDTALEFIKKTQEKEWKKIETLYKDKTEERIITDLCKFLDLQGSLSVIRHGFKCCGKTLRIAFFKPAHGLNEELEKQFDENVLGITRQLHFSERNNKSLDMVISLNGIPVITIELKNAMSGQTVENAMYQYRHDRDPREKIFEFKERTLVHFAVDTDNVFMTTRLAGNSTYFLPFNKGFEKGAGNPPDPNGRSYKTAYLWEEVLKKESLMDLFARFMHLQVEEKRNENGIKVKKETMIFPRHHQLSAVKKIVNAVKKDGVGVNYLVEHSAGSGKSNTIAWLAHRLSSLHDEQDKKIFDSVIVITDRIVLDKQLQDTIYQFEHRQGVVQKIDENSKQLAHALESAVPIIITTLQKFPFVSRQLIKLAESRGEEGKDYLPTRKCAVIVDEAHSSQSGESATDLKEVLGGEKLRKEAKKKAEEEGLPNVEALFRKMAKRGRQENLSFFAFTATPKYKTLAIFGQDRESFHQYSMRQAIEEGFIKDVLANYTTYATYFKLLKATQDDPNVERKKAAKALAKYMKLHPYNIAQKTEVMVEHFYNFTRHKIGGKAKAMVVTDSRLSAVRYKESFDNYIKEKKYKIKTLVAFSGVVSDDKVPGKSYTEEGMNNGIKEKELPEKFGTSEYQVLLVAEKYQTGFDQPLLHTMYVDKRLNGIQAVQTLSRLNRIHPLKEDTFVLDFVNDRKEIQESFKQYYEGAEMGEDVDSVRLYEVKDHIDRSGIYLNEEVERFCEVFFKPKSIQSPSDHKVMNAVLDPAVDRFRKMMENSEDEAELLRGQISSFKNLYMFLSQIIPYQDSDLEKLYTFLRYLSLKLPKRKSGPNYHFDDEVKLKYYRLQKISEGSISLIDGTKRKLDGPLETGTGSVREEPINLSQLIDILNERFGTDFNEADQLFFNQIIETAVSDEDIKQAAIVNSQDKFELIFKAMLEKIFIERMDQNEELFARYMNDPKFQKAVSENISVEVFDKINVLKIGRYTQNK